MFDDSAPGNCLCFANFMEWYSQNEKVFWFSFRSKSAFYQKALAAFFSSRYPSTSVIIVKNLMEWLLLSLVPRSSFLIGVKRQCLHNGMICLDIQIRQFQNNRQNFAKWSPNQQFCICRGSCNLFYEKRFLRPKKSDQNNKEVQKFSIFPVNQTGCSPELQAAFHPSGYQLSFPYS